MDIIRPFRGADATHGSGCSGGSISGPTGVGQGGQFRSTKLFLVMRSNTESRPAPSIIKVSLIFYAEGKWPKP